MTEETVKILRFDTGDAVKSLADLRKYIKDNKDALEGLTIGTDEYNEQLRKVQEGQDALRDSMNYGQKTITAAKGSYNDLVHSMRELKQAWRATSDEAERDKLGKQIDVINSQLKSLDASVGNYSRNVGNYENSIVSAFTKIGGSAGRAAAGGITAMTNGLKAMSATPVIAILGVLLNLLSALTRGLKSSEEGLGSVTATMGLFNGVSESVTRILQGLGGVLGKVAEKITAFADKLGLISKRTKELQALAQEEIQLDKDVREASIEDAKAEKEIADLRAKAVDKENYNSKQRMAFLEQAQKKEEEIADRRVELAEREKALLEAKNSGAKNDKETNDAIAAAEVKAIKAQTDAANKRRQNLQERNAIRNEEKAAAKAAAAEAARAAKEQAKAEQDALNARLAAEKDFLNQELSLLAAGTQERLDKQLEVRAKELEIASAAAAQKIKDQEALNKQLTLLQEIYDRDVEKLTRDFERAQVEETRKGFENRVKAMTAGTAEYLAAAVELRKYELETLAKSDGESDAAFEGRRIAAQKALQDAIREQTEQTLEVEHQARENRLLALKEGSVEYLTEALALKQYELDTLHQLEGESNEAFRAREQEAERAVMDAHKAMIDAKVKQWQGYASVVSGLGNALADMYESMSADQEKAAEHTKGVRIAAATIDTISGAIAAFMNAQNVTGNPIIDTAIGVAQAAIVTATGIAQIAKIRNTNVKGSSSSGASAPAAVAPPAVVQQVPVTRSLTSSTEEERLDRMASKQKVYLVYSDVQEAGQYVDVVDEETSFGG